MNAEHTAGDARPATPRRVVERKLKAGGEVREYECTLVHDGRPGVAVVRFVMASGGGAFGTPLVIPPGSISYGYFWRARPYNLYRIMAPDRTIIAHRLDAVADVVLGTDAISYRDLVLDWWVYPDDTIVEEDDDELEALKAAGVVTAADYVLAKRAARDVLARYRHIIDEAVAIESRFA